jgi:hypothetical protein
MEIGIISEGESDQIVIEAIVQKTFESKDIILDPLQPKPNEPGGWPLVINYCRSNEFKEAFPFKDIIIVHIDVDVLKGPDIPKDFNLQLNSLSIEETFHYIKSFLIKTIGEFYESQRDKIVFAIAINQIECWFLPVYFPNKSTICNKITGSIRQLNTVLPSQEGFYLDAKEPEYFRKISKRFFEKGVVNHCAKTNESFNLFYQQLISLKPTKVAE